MKQEFANFLVKGVIAIVEPQAQLSSSWCSSLSQIEGGYLPTLNLRALNTFLKVLPFHILCVVGILQTTPFGDWFLSIDLKDASFHILKAQHDWQFLVFCFLYRVESRCFSATDPWDIHKVFSSNSFSTMKQGHENPTILWHWLIVSPPQEQTGGDTNIHLIHVNYGTFFSQSIT